MDVKEIGKGAGSWKTTAAGVFVALAAVLTQASAALDGNPETIADWSAVLVAVSAAVGLFMARDNDVSSEDAGAK